MAWKLFNIAEGLHRFKGRSSRVGPADVGPEQLEKLIKILETRELEPELKASAWAVAIWIALLKGHLGWLQSIASVVRRLDPDERQTFAPFLDRMALPSLEILNDLQADGSLSALIDREIFRSVRLGYRGPLQVRNNTQVITWILDSTDLRVAADALQACTSVRKKRSKDDVPFKEAAKTRWAIRVGDIWPRGFPDLPNRIVIVALASLCNMIEKGSPSVSEIMLRLSRFKWPALADAKLLRALKELCISLEKHSGQISAQPLSGIIARVSEMKGAERYLTWMLTIVQRCGDDSRFRLRLREVKKSVITKIANLAVESSQLPGLARWFHVLDTSLRPRRDNPVEVPKLHLDKSKLIFLLHHENSEVARGAVLLLANTLNVTYAEAQEILKSPSENYEQEDCWAELIEGTVKDDQSSAAIDFLEQILSAGSGYVRTVKEAALSKYGLLARNSTIDIVQQETRLGLPLQDVLKLSPDDHRPARVL